MISKLIQLITEKHGIRIWALLLSLAMVLSMIPSAYASDDEEPSDETEASEATDATDPTEPIRNRPNVKDEDRYYLLSVSTGATAGKFVSFLGVRYLDKSGVERTEYIYPHDGDLWRSYQIANKLGGVNDRLDAAKTAVGYAPSLDFNDEAKMDGLQANSTDMYLIQPRYGVAKYLGVDAFISHPLNPKAEDKYAWTVKDMAFYEVDEIYGLGMKGYLSSDYYIRFSGVAMAQLTKKPNGDTHDLSILAADHLFRGDRVTSDDLDTVVPVEAFFDGGSDDEFIMELEFADSFMAGFEALATEVNDKKMLFGLVEGVTVKMEYIRKDGGTETVYVPLVLGMMSWAYENKLLTESLPHIIGVAQQGEKLIVGAKLPGFNPDNPQITALEMIRGKKGEEQARITTTGTVSRRESRSKLVEQEPVGIKRFAVYRPGTDVTRDENDAMLTLNVEESAKSIFYLDIPTQEGVNLSAGRTDFKRYLTYGEEKQSEVNLQDSYIIRIKTSDAPNAATKEEIRMKLTYRTTSGEVQSTDTLPLSELTNSYYGYWPYKADQKTEGSSDQTTNASYLSSVSAGGTLVCQMDLAKVFQFTSVTLSVDTKNTDDWQMESFEIFKADDHVRRYAKWEDISVSDRVFTRPFNDDVRNRYVNYPNAKDQEERKTDEDGNPLPEVGGIFLNASQPSITIEFGEGSRSIIHENKPVDWSKIRYSMSYEEAKQDLGFTYLSSTYNVEVKVASDSQATEDDDCGSNNLFYFKLNFSSGSSAYVLANQQLAGDGFRAGRKENFKIITNEDYGELESLSIIPANNEDVNQDVFDKLKVEYIDVTCSANAGLAKTWHVADVGWIDIGYNESTSKSHLEGELAKVCRTSSTGYAVELVFSLQTGSYERSSTDAQTGSKQQYVGSLVGTLAYYDTSGVLQKKNVDLVSEMYSYAGVAAKYYSADKSSTTTGTKAAKSDPNIMFRANHTDRFTLTVTDLRELVNFTLNPASEVTTVWKAENLTVSTIEEKGTLHISKNDEYYRTDTLKRLCSGNNADAYSVQLTQNPDGGVGAQQELRFDFTGNQYSVDTSKSPWTSTITTEPSGKNDTLNVFAYMAQSATDTPISSSDFELVGNITYTVEGGGTRRLATGRMHKDEKNNLFYVRGLKASGITGLQQLNLTADSLKRINATVAYVVIQRVRAGVLLSSERFTVGRTLTGIEKAPITLTNPTDPSSTETLNETLTLFLSDDTPSMSLINGADDIAVALRFQSIGPEGNSVYDTRYMFLSDLKDENGEQLYPAIGPNMMIQIPFHESSITDLKGILIAATGKVTATAEAACVDVVDGAGNRRAWFSFADPTELTLTPRTMTPTEDTITPVTMHFTSEQPCRVINQKIDSGKQAPLRMTVKYAELLGYDAAGDAMTRSATYVIDDISKYLVNGSFYVTDEANKVATINFYMKNLAQFRSVTLEPYDSDPYAAAEWKVSHVDYYAYIGGNLNWAEARLEGDNQLVQFRKPLSINFSTIVLRLEASYFDEENGITIRRVLDEESLTNQLDFDIDFGKVITITPTILGTLEEYSFKVLAKRLVTDSPEDGVEDDSLFHRSEDRKSIILDLPENITGEPITYLFEISSEENENVKGYVKVVLQSSEVPEEPTEDPTEPTDPTDPTEPVEPTEPTEPTETTLPTDPTEESTDPTDPEGNETLRNYTTSQSMNRGLTPSVRL